MHMQRLSLRLLHGSQRLRRFAAHAREPVFMVIPNIPQPFQHRLCKAAEQAEHEVKFLIAETQHDAVQLLHDNPRCSVLLDAVEMGATTTSGEHVRWAVDSSMIDAGHSLQWVASGQAGQDKAPLKLLHDRSIVLTNAASVAGNSLAEHSLALMLSFSRRLHMHFAGQHSRTWRERGEYSSQELAGATVLVLGFGGAGARTCELAKAFGMRVLATRRTVPTERIPACVDELHVQGPESLQLLLPQADYLVICLPLTRETRGIINSKALHLMKDSAVIVNVGRGGIVDTDDLIVALNAGDIAGAALDVMEPQPLPSDHLLWSHQNVIITPHAAGDSTSRADRIEDLIVQNFGIFLRQGTDGLLNRVDLLSGY